MLERKTADKLDLRMPKQLTGRFKLDILFRLSLLTHKTDLCNQVEEIQPV
jgi:hypothetical protein